MAELQLRQRPGVADLSGRGFVGDDTAAHATNADLPVPACDIGDEVLQRLRHGVRRHVAQFREKRVGAPPRVERGPDARRGKTPRTGGTARLGDGRVPQQPRHRRTRLAGHHRGQIRLQDDGERGFGQQVGALPRQFVDDIRRHRAGDGQQMFAELRQHIEGDHPEQLRLPRRRGGLAGAPDGVVPVQRAEPLDLPASRANRTT